MGGDGVSLPTVLIQMGNVAKTLARNQQAASTASNSLAPQDREEVRDQKKISATHKAEKQTLERRRDEKRRGKKAALGPGEDPAQDAAQEDLDDEAPAEDRGEQPGLGALIDRKA